MVAFWILLLVTLLGGSFLLIYLVYKFIQEKKVNDQLLLKTAEQFKNIINLRSNNKILLNEIDKAREISKAFYPKKEHINDSEFDIYGLCVPSHIVSGDYYDVFTSSGDIYFAIGDVTGHGLTSSILSLIISRKIRTYLDIANLDIPSVLESCNNEIVTEGTKYMSLLIGKITSGNQIEAYGKQESIIICRNTGIEILSNNSGFILGNRAFNKNTIPTYSFSIESGEFIILYSDGVSELENANGQSIGITGFIDYITNNMTYFKDMSADYICQEIVGFLAMWGADNVDDDITLLVIKRK